jgi:hypothetical protein
MDNKVESLQDLTGQESGIVVYGDEIIVANWSSISGLPKMAPANLGIIGWPAELIVVRQYSVGDIKDALPGSIVEVEDDDGDGVIIETNGMDIVCDANGDIPALWGYDLGLPCNAIINRDDAGNLAPTAGTVYELEDDVIIIAPDGWN